MLLPVGTPMPISGLMVDASLKILPLQGNAGTWQMFELGTATVIASGTVAVGANGRAVGASGQSYNPDASKTTYPYTLSGVTYTAAPTVGKWYEIVIFGTVVLSLANVACRAALFRLVPAEETPGVPKVQVSAFSTGLTSPNSAGVATLLERITAKLPDFPTNFPKLSIGENGKVRPTDVTVCGYADGMGPINITVAPDSKVAVSVPQIGASAAQTQG